VSLQFSLEMEEGADLPSLYVLAEAAGGRRFDGGVWFDRSGLNLFIGDNRGDTRLAAEDASLFWSVGARMVRRCPVRGRHVPGHL
jgi:hypothetical protein